MRIWGTGSAVPDYILTNDELSTMVETDDEWIRTRTGIRERRIAKDESLTDLAREAAAKALEAAMASAGIAREQISVLICASLGDENRCPSLACRLQGELGLREDLLAFDLNAACSGFVFALITASKLVGEGQYALVVGAEKLSNFVDFSDRSTCVLFGDGAGAVVVGSPGAENSSATTFAVPVAQSFATPSAAPSATSVTPSAAPSAMSVTPSAQKDAPDFCWVTEVRSSELLKVDDRMHMDGHAVFKFAVGVLEKMVRKVSEKAGLGLEEVDLFICHQANERIINSVAKRLKLPRERFFMNLAKYGNTSAASIPLALDEAVRIGVVRPGSKLIMAGFGGGLTAGAVCFSWS